MNYKLFRFVAIAAVVMCAFQPARAQSKPYDGLDIVFLVDQSDSMGRNTGAGIPNDDLGLRFYSLLYATSLMGDYRLLVNDAAVFQVGVISFGETAEFWNFSDSSSNPVYWQTIAPQSRDAWKPEYVQLEKSFNKMKDDFSQRDLGSTNFQAAFEAARSLFSRLPDSSGNHLRVIIVLTDGQPYLNAVGFDASNHMNAVASFAGANFNSADYRIYTVGMIDANDPYWKSMEPYWETITKDPCTSKSCSDTDKDRASLVANNDDVGKRFQEILRDLTEEILLPDDTIVIDQTIVPGPLVVPPYLKSISFNYFKSDPAQQLLLTDPEGKVDDSRAGVETDGVTGPIQVFRISNPVPGQWMVGTDPAGVDVDITMRYIFAQSRLDSPTGTQVQFVPLTVRYALLDELGQPLPTYKDPRYSLLVNAVVTAGGQSWPLTLNRNSDNSYSAEFTPVLTGVHSVSVKAESQDLDGKQIIVFENAIGSFDVSPATLVPKNLPFSWPQYSQDPITFELQDYRGFPVSAPASLDLVVTVGGEDISQLELVQEADGTYRALYTPNKTGVHNVHVFASVLDSSGIKQTIMDSDVGQFEVVPTVRVAMVVQKPEKTEQLDGGAWPFSRSPLVLQIQLKDENGKALDPLQVLAGDPDQALVVTKIQDNKGNAVVADLKFQRTPEKGVYMAETDDIGRGDYVLTVAGNDLKSGYVYRNKEIQIKINRIRHPLQIPILILLVAAVVAASGTVVSLAVRNKKLAKHPCKGMIYIVDAYGVPKFQKRLDSYGKNDITIRGKEISPITHVQKMRFWCESDAQNRDGKVFAQVWLDNDRTPVASIDGKLLSPGSETKLGKYAFWLHKDPDEIPDHPESQIEESLNE